jgi:SAM-dependent methyltransferase
MLSDMLKTAKLPSFSDTRVIYCGDNLELLRQLPSSCINLVYIDPPVGSAREFGDFGGRLRPQQVPEELGTPMHNYLAFMRSRCKELRRVLADNGSLYYHCDWHASHYVKVLLDEVFGEGCFRNEIIWKRAAAFVAQNLDPPEIPHVYDSLLLYSKGKDYVHHTVWLPYSKEYVDAHYSHVEEGTGRRYRISPLTTTRKNGSTRYEWILPNGQKVKPDSGHGWVYTEERMRELEKQGRLFYTETGIPQRKQYLDEMPGQPVGDLWDDLVLFDSAVQDRLAFPTQKPIALLNRIIQTSSNENDIVLDAFCGTGTTLVAAEDLKRRWVGIEISPTACQIAARRLEGNCTLKNVPGPALAGRGVVIRNLSWSEEQLRKMSSFEFESWAVIALGGIPNSGKGPDLGIDGRIFPTAGMSTTPSDGALHEQWDPIQVKQSVMVGLQVVREFAMAMKRFGRKTGYLVGFDFNAEARKEVVRFLHREQLEIRLLTVGEILRKQVSAKPMVASNDIILLDRVPQNHILKTSASGTTVHYRLLVAIYELAGKKVGVPVKIEEVGRKAELDCGNLEYHLGRLKFEMLIDEPKGGLTAITNEGLAFMDDENERRSRAEELVVCNRAIEFYRQLVQATDSGVRFVDVDDLLVDLGWDVKTFQTVLPELIGHIRTPTGVFSSIVEVNQQEGHATLGHIRPDEDASSVLESLLQRKDDLTEQMNKVKRRMQERATSHASGVAKYNIQISGNAQVGTIGDGAHGGQTVQAVDPMGRDKVKKGQSKGLRTRLKIFAGILVALAAVISGARGVWKAVQNSDRSNDKAATSMPTSIPASTSSSTPSRLP